MATRYLPSNPSLEHLKIEAKSLLVAFQSNDAGAVARFLLHPRAQDAMKQEMKLADAQHVLAFEYAFESWRQLKEYVASDVAAVETAVLNEDAAALDEALRTDPQWRRRQEKWRGERRERDLLTYVATRGSIRLVDVLLGHGVQSQVDIPSVFYHCLQRRQIEVADHLLKECDVEIHHLQQHLYQLTEDLNVEGVSWLLAHGANPDYRRAGIKWTPLHNCLHTYPTLNRNRQQISRLLVEAGADHDDNALYDLLAGRLDRLVERLDATPALVHEYFDLRGGRDMEIERRGDYGGAPVSNTTLLHHCAEFGWLEEAELLLMRGADVNARARPTGDEVDTHTPIFHTLTTNNNASWEVLNLLIDSGADVNIRAKVRIDKQLLEVTPMGYINQFPNRYWKADTTAGTASGSVLDTAPHLEVVELLRRHGAQV
ncbi:MAG TPA: hypothetical protein EYQ31_08790 [Candidatus Handelsmanbacteria bacterium]|nr:hypothetical protein [Candidatus Handelsmanbacteria bacterium]